MKINYMSDLHTEFDRPSLLTEEGSPLTLPGGDVLVLAGDIAVKANTDFIMNQAHKYEDVVLIDGNHEFYHGNVQTTHTQIAANLLPTNVHYLEKEVANVAGTRFLGTTLWGGYHIPYSEQAADRGMNDHRIISNMNGRFTANAAKYLHEKNVEWLSDNIEPGDVVVTHHAPSRDSIDLTRYGDVPINGAYYDDLEELILDTKPAIWFHGHVHHSLDYMIGDTRVLCNPRGYVNYEENPDFNIDATVEV
jgi:Icc-related predicted phosphoesterase